MSLAPNLTADDKQDISELLSRSSYALDMRIENMLAECFAEDAQFTLKIGDADLVGPFVNRDGIMQLMTGSFEEQTDQRRHVVSNVFFETSAVGDATVVSNLTLFGTEDGSIRLISAGVYRDDVVKRDGKWQLFRRHLDLDLPY
ncbi:MAG: nuclear transport factor 2 family protein [Pseudomonadales bacterium]